MKQVTINRYYRGDDVTLGSLDVDGVYHHGIFTLERPWKDNKRNVSCIPVGDYFCSPFNGKRFQNTYEVKDVCGRSYILFHGGNYVRDTHGCIIPGLAFHPLNKEPMILNSGIAMNYLREILGKDEFKLKIQESD